MPDILEQYFACKPEEEEALIQSIPAGVLRIRVTETQAKKWRDDYSAEKAKLESMKPWKPLIHDDSPLPFLMAGAGLRIVAIALLVFFAVMAMPTPWVCFLIIAVVLAVSIVLLEGTMSVPLYNFFTDADKKYNRALVRSSSLYTGAELFGKLSRLIESGRFECLDFSDPPIVVNIHEEDQEQPISYDNSLLQSALPIIYSRMDFINSRIIKTTWQTKLTSIKNNDNTTYFLTDSINTSTRDKHRAANSHYQHGLSFFTNFKDEVLPKDIAGVIVQQWMQTPGFKDESIEELFKFKLQCFEDIEKENQAAALRVALADSEEEYSGGFVLE